MTAIIIGTDQADTVIRGFTSIPGQPLATIGADSIIGLGGNDILHGLEGGDTLDGGRGQDTMDGGPNDDSFRLRGEILGEADSIDGGTGRDSLDLSEWTTFPVIRLDLTAGTLFGGAGGGLFLFASIVPSSVEYLFGSGFDEWVRGTAASNLLIGGGGADTLIGEGQADTLAGGAGDDRLEGGTGNDQLRPGGGSDTLIGGDGFDSADYRGVTAALWLTIAADGAITGGGAAADDLFSGIEALAGGEAADTLTSVSDGPSELRGGGGGDLLIGGSNVTMDGGPGGDTYRLLRADALPFESVQDGGRDRIEAPFDYTLGNNFEDLLLTDIARYGAGNMLGNRITGNALANLLEGMSGADTLDGGGGADVLVGGAGYDLYIVDDSGDLVADSDGRGEVHALASFTLTGGITVLWLASDGGLAGTGSVGADTIQGGGGADTLRGADGNDTLDGDAGGDLLIGGEGADRLFAYDWRLLGSGLLVGGDWVALLYAAARGADTLEGGLGDDVYEVGAEDVILPDAGGMDTVSAIGSFTLPGGIEALALIGFADIRLDGTGNGLANRLVGHDAANRLAGGGGADSLDGNRGHDTLLGGAGADLLLGDEGEDMLQGGADADTLDGADGDDVLLGGAGDDRLSGMGGLDRLRGDAGADRFVLGDGPFGATAADRLLDFDAAEGDRIAIQASRLPGATLPAGPLDPALFAANLSGRLAIPGPSFVYETDAGRLWYDDDWSAGADRVLVAILIGTPALTAAEITLI